MNKGLTRARQNRETKRIWKECINQAKKELGKSTESAGIKMLEYDPLEVTQKAKSLMMERTGVEIHTFFD